MITNADLDRLHSASVRTLDGSCIGHVSDVYVDGDDQPLLLTVRSSRLSLREVLVPADGAVLVGRELLVTISDAALADAPATTDPSSGSNDLLDRALAHWEARQILPLERSAALQAGETTR